MKITPSTVDIDLLAGSGEGRSTGVHASDLYTSLYQALEPNRYVVGSKPNSVKMMLGLAFEQYLEKILIAQGAKVFRPGELFTSDGIAYSPDLLIENGADRVGEIKVTWMSNLDDLTDPKFGKWLVQAMFYCHHVDIPRVRFYVLYINGNYRDRRDPEFVVTDIEFSSQELKDNHQMLINHGKHVGLL